MGAWDIIQSAARRVGICDNKALAEATGIKYQTIARNRSKDPSTLRGFEFGSIVRHTAMKDEDIVEIVRSWA